jgi:hypothetical protein
MMGGYFFTSERLHITLIRRGLLFLELDTDRRTPDTFFFQYLRVCNHFTFLCARDNKMSDYILILFQCC